MKKYIDKDKIKRALKMCASTCFRICCPYGDAINCCGKLKEAALTLITEQEKEIEELKAENEKYLDSIESVQVGRCRLRCPLTEQAVKQAKIDVLTELKEKCESVGVIMLTDHDIDKMIEEIKNEN